jgi:polysaccharide chain length determinant protein (PEP-CTERM system associated)
MSNPGHSGRPKAAALSASPPLEHYLQLILHRKWLIASVFVVVTAIVTGVVQALPNIYTAQTLILVDPQKVPESYVKSTVTGSVRDRLSTLSQQILSATRLQKIIDSLHLYQAERKTMAREEILAKMRKDILTTVVSDFGAGADLQAFRISYSGTSPTLVARVTNQLTQLFIDENLKARELQSTGTTEFIENQLQESRKTLEEQEAKLKDFRMKHIGEMPEQQSADLQILGQLQSHVQLEGEALNRAEQQKNYLQSMMTQTIPVIDMDSGDETGAPAPAKAAQTAAPAAPKKSALATDREKLAELLTRYKETYPDVVKLKKQIADEEAKQGLTGAVVERASVQVPVPPPPSAPASAPATVPVVAPARHFNPVLQGQLETCDAEIAKHKEEIQRVSKMIVGYQSKLEAIPVREQEVTSLVRDYEMTKAHYAQLEGLALSAETATQLEFRQKGERFLVLDPAVTPEKPSSPNRPLLDAAGALAGLLLGLVVAMSPEIFGMTIIGPQDITSTSNLTILEIIPVIKTHADEVIRRRRIVFALASAVVATVAAGAILFLHFRSRI